MSQNIRIEIISPRKPKNHNNTSTFLTCNDNRNYGQILKFSIQAHIPYFCEYFLWKLFFFELLKPWKSDIVSALSFLLCNENLNSFLTRARKQFKGGNCSREETIGEIRVLSTLTKWQLFSLRFIFD